MPVRGKSRQPDADQQASWFMRPKIDELPKLGRFPSRTFDKLRYGDTDRQGHVNNAVFSTFLETGRVDLLHDPSDPMACEGAAFVIANLNIDYLAEIHWPGRVEIGTAIVKIGNSSLALRQAVFQAERCVASAETVLVQMNDTTRKSQPLCARTKSRLENYRLAE